MQLSTEILSLKKAWDFFCKWPTYFTRFALEWELSVGILRHYLWTKVSQTIEHLFSVHVAFFWSCQAVLSVLNVSLLTQTWGTCKQCRCILCFFLSINSVMVLLESCPPSICQFSSFTHFYPIETLPVLIKMKETFPVISAQLFAFTYMHPWCG